MNDWMVLETQSPMGSQGLGFHDPTKGKDPVHFVYPVLKNTFCSCFAVLEKKG